MLEFAFMQRALVAALLVGIVAGALGVFVVLRRLAFLGVGIAHSAVGGVALGLVLGTDPLLSAGVFAAIVALAIGVATRRGGLDSDAVIGVFFSGSMALAVLLFSLDHGYRPHLFGYLFGDVLATSGRELAGLGAAGGVVLACLALTWRQHLFVAFDEELARAYGHRVERLDALLLVLVAATVVIGMRLVGALLIQALLVVPAAVAVMWSRRLGGQVLISVALGAGAGGGGLALAWQLDTAAGATIVLTVAAAFFASLLFRRRAA